MESADLYHIKQQFILGAYKALVDLVLPDSHSSDYIPTVVYKSRALIALGNAGVVEELVPAGSDNIALKAVAALAKYVSATDSTAKDASLEDLRDLCVEIEGDDVESTDRDKAYLRVLAGTAFAKAGEIEEALDTLGQETEDLEAVSVIVQIFLSINRPDLAKRSFERSKEWAEDDLLLQLIESNIGLVTGKDVYSNTVSFYTEQLGNPSLSSPHILTGRGVTRILRNELPEARSDLEESLQQQPSDVEAMAALVVVSSLLSKKGEAEELWQKMQKEHPTYPMVLDVAKKSALFDEAVTKYVVPSIA